MGKGRERLAGAELLKKSSAQREKGHVKTSPAEKGIASNRRGK